MDQAQEALELAIEGMLEDGQTPPGPLEEAGLPEYDLTEFESPLVLLVPSPGPVEIEVRVERIGRSMTTTSARLLQSAR